MRLLTNFSFRHFDPLLGPPLASRPNSHISSTIPLFDRIGLLVISLRVLYRTDYRCESLSKTGVRRIAKTASLLSSRLRHSLNSIDFRIASVLRITLNRTPNLSTP
jgi:hypothetical protein